jgi:hypothetical protein
MLLNILGIITPVISLTIRMKIRRIIDESILSALTPKISLSWPGMNSTTRCISLGRMSISEVIFPCQFSYSPLRGLFHRHDDLKRGWVLA